MKVKSGGRIAYYSYVIIVVVFHFRGRDLTQNNYDGVKPCHVSVNRGSVVFFVKTLILIYFQVLS